MTSALDGLRILDLSRVLAGPICTQILGDLGAEIIKIERPGSGDDTRAWGPPFLKDQDGKDTKESAYYLCANRNKKSVALDISTPEGQALIHRLISTSDILIENFKVGGLDKYGLSYHQIKDRYPTLVYASISGYGRTGPLATEPGYDFIAQGMGGLMAATGPVDGPPSKAGVAISDYVTGLYAAIGILAALAVRTKTGLGQYVDCSLLDSTIAMMTNVAQYYLTGGTPAPRVGNAHPTIVPYQAFETQDGHVIIAIGNDAQFSVFCNLIGHPDWVEDPRFKTNAARVIHRTSLLSLLTPLIQSETTRHWVTACRQADIPAGPINNMDQVFSDPQTIARNMAFSMTHPLTKDPIQLIASPLNLSKTPVSYRNAPPMLGADTQEVLEKLLNIGSDEQEQLRQKKIIDW